MPFVKKDSSQASLPQNEARRIFIGREGELLFFVKNILEPEDPTHNIISISGLGKERPSAEVVQRLEAIIELDPGDCWSLVCRGVVLWLSSHFEEALTLINQANLIKPEIWDPYFWKGMVCASRMQDTEATAAIEKSLELELPPILLTPLHWFEQERPDFFQKYAAPLLAHYDLL